jgi:hypothetical protein
MGLTQMVVVCVVLVFLSANTYHEYLRYKDARNIALDQRTLYEHILGGDQGKGCALSNVRSVEYRGAVYDCRSLKLSLQRSVEEHAYALWWQTSWWVLYMERATANMWAMTAITIATIVATIWLGLSACLQMRVNDRLTHIIPQQQQQQHHQVEYYSRPPPPPPPTKVIYKALPSAQYRYEEEEENQEDQEEPVVITRGNHLARKTVRL